MDAIAAETAADACSHIKRKQSSQLKHVAAPDAANPGRRSKRKAQSRMVDSSPNEFDRYLRF
jgi:hypothetical protein